MTQMHRRWHRLLFIGLTILLPTLFFTALSKRQAIPTNKNLPAVLVSPKGELAQVVSEFHFSDQPLSIRTHTDNTLSIALAGQLDYPDPLVYFATSPPSGEHLPETSILLGPPRDGHQLALPASASGDGYLVLYSLAHARVFAHMSFTLPNRFEEPSP